MPYVDVVFNLNLDKSYTYQLPPGFITNVFIGQRVLVPFGKREITGIIVKLDVAAGDREYKNVIDLLDDEPLITKELITLTGWMADYYLASWGQSLQLALPKGLEKKSQLSVMPAIPDSIDMPDLSEKQRLLLDIIVREPGRLSSYYMKKAGSGSFHHSLRALEFKNLIVIDKQVSAARIRKKMGRYITIGKEIEGKLAGLRNQDQLKRMLVPLRGQILTLPVFTILTGFSHPRIKALVRRKVLTIHEQEVSRRYTFNLPEEKKTISLNQEQEQALVTIKAVIDSNHFEVFLLHGVTGSGKTQVYLESIKRAIDLNKSAIVLVPEIGLTPQTVGRFEAFFPGMVSVFHSKMGLGERYDTWRKIAREQVSIVIGPRSALFLPVNNLGIIIIDEEHDTSYKQDEKAPHYHARDTAVYRAKINNAVVVLGSATPSLESYSNALAGKYHLLKLTSRIENLAMPAIEIIDTKKTRSADAQSRILSPYLESEIRNVLQQKEQIILLQNRRGFSTFLQCQICGFSARCQNCDIYLTYHTHSNSLQCHYCGYSYPATPACPKCQGTQIKYSGAGTQQIEKIIRKRFPGVRLLRMDMDTTSAKGAHEKILKQFRDGQADILLGTQMIAKGLDFENVSLVGVISAEIGLILPDFRSAERIFQLLTQVAGRPGRKNKQGKVIIQTTMDNHYAIRFARKHDYNGFYALESEYRRESEYPPFGRLVKIGITAAEKQEAARIAADIIKKLSKLKQNVFRAIGPAPSPVARLKNRYRWQIILKINQRTDPAGKNSRHLLRQSLNPYLTVPADRLHVYVDVDPLNLM
jgi:primosomal protein N' (replication factor Y)